MLCIILKQLLRSPICSAYTLSRLEGPLAIEGEHINNADSLTCSTREHHTDAHLTAPTIANGWRLVIFEKFKGLERLALR